MLHRRIAMGMVGAVAAAALIGGCGGGSSSTSSSPASTTTAAASDTGTATVPAAVPVTGNLANVNWNLIWGEPNTLDPLTGRGYSPTFVEPILCDTLFRRDPVTGELVPGLVKSTSRPDQKTFVYDLRDDVKFWDGNPLTADDVVFSLTRNMDPNVAFSQYPFFANVKSITATGPHQVTVKFTKPDTLFEQALPLSSNSAISEAAFVKRAGKKYGTPAGKVMCSGPFKLESWTPGNNMVLVPNTDYWDQELVPKVDKLTLTFVVDTSAVTAALLAGSLDGTTDVPPSAIKALQGSSTGNFYATSGPGQYQIRVAGGSLQNADVRKALSLVIDRPSIAKGIFSGLASPATEFYMPWTWATYPEAARQVFADAQAKLPGATLDLDAAKAAFEAAGSPKDPIVLGVQGGDKVQEDIAAIIQSEAAKIGMNVEIKSMSVTEYNGVYAGPDGRKGVDGVLMASASSVPDPQMLAPFYVLPGQLLNWINYDNASVTSDVAKARSSFDPVERAKLLVAAQEQFIGKDQIVIPIVDTNYLSFVNKKVGGFVPTFNNVYFSPWAARLGAAE